MAARFVAGRVVVPGQERVEGALALGAEAVTMQLPDAPEHGARALGQIFRIDLSSDLIPVAGD